MAVSSLRNFLMVTMEPNFNLFCRRSLLMRHSETHPFEFPGGSLKGMARVI